MDEQAAPVGACAQHALIKEDDQGGGGEVARGALVAATRAKVLYLEKKAATITETYVFAGRFAVVRVV